MYMASATGATVHMHYCMGKFMSASFIEKDEDSCEIKCCEKKSRQKDCCKDEHKTVKTSDHQLAKASFDLPLYQPALPILAYFERVSRPFPTYSKLAEKAHSPPSLWRTCPIFIEVRNFRI